jgi:hypothetical protein
MALSNVLDAKWSYKKMTDAHIWHANAAINFVISAVANGLLITTALEWVVVLISKMK